MSKRYQKLSEDDLCSIYSTSTVEEAVTKHMNRKGVTLISVSYIGGCKASGQHVYHFIRED